MTISSKYSTIDRLDGSIIHTYEHSDIDYHSWPEPWRQLTRYIADRTGIMSFANLLLIWVFAGRNNIFIWATGWSFAKFNIFHRHVAWIATLQAVVHTIAYLSLFIRSKPHFPLSSFLFNLLGLLRACANF